MTVQVGNDEIAKVMIGNKSLFDDSESWTRLAPIGAANTTFGECFANLSQGTLTIIGSVVQHRGSTDELIRLNVCRLPAELRKYTWIKSDTEYIGGNASGGYSVSSSLSIEDDGTVAFNSSTSGLTTQVSASFHVTFVKKEV